MIHVKRQSIVYYHIFALSLQLRILGIYIFFLGAEALFGRLNLGLLLSQQRYILDLIKKTKQCSWLGHDSTFFLLSLTLLIL